MRLPRLSGKTLGGDVKATRDHPFRPVVVRSWFYLATPVALAVIGSVWIEVALRHFEQVTTHERRGIIGWHYSVPEWGFEYRPQGRSIEKWAFEVPSYTTFVLLLASALYGSLRLRRDLGVWGIVGLVSIHIFAALGFVFIYMVLWVEAASVFI